MPFVPTGADPMKVPLSKKFTVPVGVPGTPEATSAVKVTGEPAVALGLELTSDTLVAAGPADCTVWNSGTDSEPAKVESPEYAARIEWVPRARVEMLMLATPLFTAAFPIKMSSEKKLTLAPTATDGFELTSTDVVGAIPAERMVCIDEADCDPA